MNYKRITQLSFDLDEALGEYDKALDDISDVDYYAEDHRWDERQTNLFIESRSRRLSQLRSDIAHIAKEIYSLATEQEHEIIEG